MIEEKTIKIKHNYTSELELKSLLIRIKKDREGITSKISNGRINKYIKWHTDINNKKYDNPSKRNIVKGHLKENIVRLSELTAIDDKSYERFGEIILLMIKNILKKPQFSGYTYRDDFYSDAIYKILKYLGNFNHLLISERTGTPVNAFAYISQIIHNSILYIINTKKKEQENIKKYNAMEYMANVTQYNAYDWPIDNPHEIPKDEPEITETIILKNIDTTLIDVLRGLSDEINRVNRLNVYYPPTYKIMFEEYNELKDLLKGKVSIMRSAK